MVEKNPPKRAAPWEELFSTVASNNAGYNALPSDVMLCILWELVF